MKLMKCFFLKKKMKIIFKRKFWGKKEGDGVVGGSGEWIKRPLPAGGWSRRLKRNIFFKKKKKRSGSQSSGNNRKIYRGASSSCPANESSLNPMKFPFIKVLKFVKKKTEATCFMTCKCHYRCIWWTSINPPMIFEYFSNEWGIFIEIPWK